MAKTTPINDNYINTHFVKWFSNLSNTITTDNTWLTTTTDNTATGTTYKYTITSPSVNNTFVFPTTGNFVSPIKQVKRHRNKIAQGWANVDNWYIGPRDPSTPPVFDKDPHAKFRYETDACSKYLQDRLAHKCQDGKLRAPTGVRIHRLAKNRGFSIYGKCSHCGDKISEKIKTIVRLEELDV